ncbi:hypothetical protein [Terracoccus sp. 273MFTsu3.1]|uniref:hypothetical protein n=1 Tax=Terracoccus sp. 273MFTsu3.1 TaxID=1172188 RepID=UPI00037DDF4C|nr:hypothetical protein [Terracoccus sp. 273MFTsu3.1]
MLLPAVVAVHLLALAAFASPAVRLSADDWCAAARVHAFGPLGFIDYYYSKVNGRLAYHVAQVLVFADGLRGARVLPFVLIVTMTVGIFTVLYLALRHLRWRWPAAAAGLLAVVVSALTFFAGNVVYQILFWSAATVTHTLPVVLGVWNVVLLIVAARSPRRWVRVTAVVLALFMGFVIGSLGEAFFVVGGVYAAAALMFALLAWRDPRARFPITWLAVWLMGTLAGFAVLYFSPGQRVRTRVAYDQAQSSIMSAQGFSEAVHGWLSSWEIILSQPAYYVAIVTGLLVGLLASGAALRATSLPFAGGSWTLPRTVLVAVLPAVLVGIASFGVIAGLRQGYGPSGWGYQRAWTSFLLPAIVTAALYGAAAGYWLGRRVHAWQRNVAVPAMAALLGVSALFSTVALGSVVPRNTALVHEMTDRAKAWDQNTAAVQRQILEGKRVVQFTPTPIAASTEPFRYITTPDWAGNCAAVYYGVDRLVPSEEWLSTPASEDWRELHPAAR